ncbi:type I-B CRISPR-associated protein Cas7/Cst2/DevR [candidate division WOR-3 bacterium]|nr:type I-B CRISPR-associated protein Cas7/Cst2/DevR [candidate division WOR-3 bacterium]
MNLFGTVLTYTAPSANYRGESAENRSVIQKITKGRFEFAIISPEAMRNALRETLRTLGLPCNRTRLHDEEQLAVKFEDYPDAEKYADDFFMGWLIAASGADRKKIQEELKKKKRDLKKFTFKRDSVLRMNMAVALEPYRHDSVFTQSPQDKTPKEIKAHKNVENVQLLHRETTVTAYQYPFALNLDECKPKSDWTKALLKGIGQLNDAAGNHARSYFEMAPASIVLRLTNQLVAGYSTYGFQVTEDGKHNLPEIVDGIRKDDYPGSEFYIGGKIVKDMDEKTVEALKVKGVKLDRSPQRLLEQVSNDAFK